VSYRRLGRSGHDRNRLPRPLLVQLTSEENVSSLLAVAKQLRTSSDQHVAESVYRPTLGLTVICHLKKQRKHMKSVTVDKLANMTEKIISTTISQQKLLTKFPCLAT